MLNTNLEQKVSSDLKKKKKGGRKVEKKVESTKRRHAVPLTLFPTDREDFKHFHWILLLKFAKCMHSPSVKVTS